MFDNIPDEPLPENINTREFVWTTSDCKEDAASSSLNSGGGVSSQLEDFFNDVVVSHEPERIYNFQKKTYRLMLVVFTLAVIGLGLLAYGAKNSFDHRYVEAQSVILWIVDR